MTLFDSFRTVRTVCCLVKRPTSNVRIFDLPTGLVYIHDIYLLTILETPIIHSVYPEFCLYLIAF